MKPYLFTDVENKTDKQGQPVFSVAVHRKDAADFLALLEAAKDNELAATLARRLRSAGALIKFDFTPAAVAAASHGAPRDPR